MRDRVALRGRIPDSGRGLGASVWGPGLWSGGRRRKTAFSKGSMVVQNAWTEMWWLGSTCLGHGVSRALAVQGSLSPSPASPTQGRPHWGIPHLQPCEPVSPGCWTRATLGREQELTTATTLHAYEPVSPGWWTRAPHWAGTGADSACLRL